jgi:3-deoxy-manno-octulosonate cytidylyltransferase (CMP-KDO synthetase)
MMCYKSRLIFIILIYSTMSKILCCIPARYNSTRLPGKPLLKINGKTIINHVYDKAKGTKVDDIIVLTDDQRVFDEVSFFGGKCSIITEECVNGTDRIIHHLKDIGANNDSYDIIVNIQGDEPFIKSSVINQAIDNFINKGPECSTICFKTTNESEILSKSRGKAVVDKFDNIMYCSRNVIPTNKNYNIIKDHKYNIHVGIFVYDKNYLLNHFCKENTKNQLLEDIEWLKIIEQGFKINAIFAEELERGVDTIEDYEYLKHKYDPNA